MTSLADMATKATEDRYWIYHVTTASGKSISEEAEQHEWTDDEVLYLMTKNGDTIAKFTKPRDWYRTDHWRDGSLGAQLRRSLEQIVKV